MAKRLAVKIAKKARIDGVLRKFFWGAGVFADSTENRFLPYRIADLDELTAFGREVYKKIEASARTSRES